MNYSCLVENTAVAGVATDLTTLTWKFLQSERKMSRVNYNLKRSYLSCPVQNKCDALKITYYV